eukprot:gene52675-biopygen43314
MDKRLHLLETFTARGSDGQTYVIHGYEHLVQLDTLQDVLGQWEPTGLAEYKAADGRPVHVAADGTMTLERSGVTLQREPTRLH